MPVADFLDLLVTTVTVEPRIGFDEYGNPILGAPVSARARISRKASLVPVPGGSGEQVSARGMIWMAYTAAMTPNDRVTFPDGETPEIVTIEQPYDETGAVHHTKVIFK